jgi:predicted alpha-1,2-mannosidase
MTTLRLCSAGIFLGLLLAPLSIHAAAPNPIGSVDPFIGTDGHGHTFPGAVLPFGMAALSPDTRTETWDGCSGYLYSDKTILGFSHTHLSGTGGGCLGDVMVMPTVGAVHFDAGQPGDGYMSRFSHTREAAQPGYYRVYLQDPKVTAELTATERCGFHRYTFPAADNAHIAIDLDHGIQSHASDSEIRAENSTTISGFRKSNGWGGSRIVYYVMQFSKPFDSIDLQKSGEPLPPGTKEASGGVMKASVNYHTKAGEAILIKVGVSGTSIEGARKNLKAEISGWDFKGVRNAAGRAWSRALDSAQIETPDPHLRRTFYTNLYLSYIGPSLFNDVDGAYRGLDHQVHTKPGFQNYTAFSLWDTYRAEHPLLTLLQPGRVDDMVSTMLTQYHQQGSRTTPIWPLWENETWCMIGYHSTAVMADAYLKGFRGFDAEAAYQAMRDTAMQDRNGQDTYKTLGYVASTPGMQATSKTIEYAVDDWCIARMAEKLGHHEDALMFYKRAGHYVNLYDSATGFLRGRKANGEWRPKFDAIGQINDEYTEADAWQYAFAVQQDVPGMIRMHGGDAAFIKKLDTLFTMSSKTRTIIPDITGLIGQYAQGDEQCHHIAYLYNYAGQPYKTQKWVREIMRSQYQDTPAGECGNVDCGQMSAWYVFSALGFYPVNPAAGVYAIGSPAVSKSVLHLDGKKYGGREFTVIAQNNSPKNVYIQSATWNGKPFGRTWITHRELTGGGVLRLVMGPKPNPQWGVGSGSRPPATMPAGFQYAKFPTPAAEQNVTLTVPIRVACGSDDPIGAFVSDPNMLDGQQNSTEAPVEVNVAHAAPAAIYQCERYANDFTWSYSVPKGRYTVRLHFADVFDKEAGQRLENAAINGSQVLKNFDIIATAGGTHKAVVKSFAGVRPDASGKIAIRLWAAPTSPDGNAKINAIEILPE